MRISQFSNYMPELTITRAYAGTVIYPPGGRYGPRLQTDLQLVILHTGEMRVRLDDAIHNVPANTVSLLKPGHVEEFWFDEDKETWHRWIAISLREYPVPVSDWFAQLPLFVTLTAEMNQLVDVMHALQKGTGQSTGRDDTLMSLAVSALTLFISECQQQRTLPNVHPSVWSAKSYIREHYREDLHLADVAEHAHVTPEHLVRLFRQTDGQTPIQYLWAHRVQQGLRLLQDTGLSVADVAEQAGFKTSHHFARTIKARTGMTPTEVRRRSWVGGNSTA